MNSSISHVTKMLFLLVILSLTLIGCQSAPDTATKAEAAEPTAEVSTGPVELTFWTFLDPNADDPRGKALNKIVTGFNESHPDIQVKVENIHWSKIDGQVIQATAAGAGPDLINIYSVQLAQHVGANTIQPMTDYVTAWLKEEGKDYIFPIETVTYNNEVMALPWEMRVWLLMYRKDLLEEAGLPVPQTLDQLAEVAGQLSTDQRTGLAIGFSEASLGADFVEKFEPLLWGAGGELLDDNDEAAFTGAAGEKTMQWLYDAYHTDKAFGREALSMTADDVLAGVKAGTVAMTIQGSMRVGAARDSAETGDNLATAPVPGWTEDAPLPALVAGQTLTIGKDTEHPDEAWEFIQYYLNEESQLAFAEAGVMPVISSAYDSPQLAESPQAEEFKMWRDYAQAYGRMGHYPEDFPKLSEIMVKSAQQIIFNDAPLTDTLSSAADQYNSIN
ncbi:MAG: extracellular solute-binding protein [Anaerolineae bacterium]|nr:extracellular solute-binding protein [Anaerolineae bacterium]